MHFAVKPRAADVAMSERKLPTVCDDESDDALECAASVFLSDFAGLGYENEQLIAVTDTSLIFRASTSWFQGSVSIKLLRSELLESRFAQKIFSQEAAMVSELNHPNIAPLYNYGIASNGAPYMVNHFVPGWSLRELNMQGVVVEPVSLFIQICEGLAFAHSQNVMHGRLSASKVIASAVRKDLFVSKIIDFSVTAALRWQLPFSLASLRSSASPEECFGQDPDFSSDLYSLGYIMYETLTGSKPTFNRDKKVIGFSKLRGVSQLLEPLVVRCLAYESKDRYQSANELLFDLRTIEAKIF
ncbi:hypothetical protein BH10CYA1_BH10CYA1_02970 [soil metagenome]